MGRRRHQEEDDDGDGGEQPAFPSPPKHVINVDVSIPSIVLGGNNSLNPSRKSVERKIIQKDEEQEQKNKHSSTVQQGKSANNEEFHLTTSIRADPITQQPKSESSITLDEEGRTWSTSYHQASCWQNSESNLQGETKSLAYCNEKGALIKETQTPEQEKTHSEQANCHTNTKELENDNGALFLGMLAKGNPDDISASRNIQETFSGTNNEAEEKGNNSSLDIDRCRMVRDLLSIEEGADVGSDDDESGSVSIRPGAQRIAGVPVSDRLMHIDSVIVGSIDNLDYLNQEESIPQPEEIAADVVDEDELRQELVGNIVQAEIVPATLENETKTFIVCWISCLFFLVLGVGITLGIVLLRPDPIQPTGPSPASSEAPTISFAPTSKPSKNPSVSPSTSPEPTHQPTITPAPTDLCDSVGLNISFQCDHNIWTEEVEDCDKIPVIPNQISLFDNPLELVFRFNGDHCDATYPLIFYGVVECEDFGRDLYPLNNVFIDFLDGDEMGDFSLSFDEVTTFDFLNISNGGFLLPDRMNATIYENQARGNKLQTISFPTYTIPADGSRDYLLLDRLGSIQLVAYRTMEFGLVSSLYIEEARYLDINLVFTIQAKRRFELETFFVVTNRFGVINLTSRVNGEFVDSRPTSPLVVGPFEIDLLNQTRYTFFATVTGNLLGESCHKSSFFEFDAGWI